MTTPGPTLVYQCPNCRGQFKRRTIGSGNTVGARVRSDGRMFAPMLLLTPPLVACPHCTSAIQIFYQEPIAQFRTYFPSSFLSKILHEEKSLREIEEETEEHKLATFYRDTPIYQKVTAEKYFDFLENNEFEKEVEIELRKNALWVFNDETYRSTIPHRFREEIDQELETSNTYEFEHNERAQKNLQLLAEALGEVNEDDLLLKAELLRELGMFKQAHELLDRNLANGTAAEQIIKHAESKDSEPFLLASIDDQYEWEYAWKARRYEPEKITNPSEELKPPLFKISNRNWYVKVLGMLSHNWALIEENKDNTATVYFFQDHVEGDRPAIVDSLNFDDEIAACQAIKHNGFDLLKEYPGPWMGCEPKGYFYDERPTAGNGIYSSGQYWKDDYHGEI